MPQYALMLKINIYDAPLTYGEDPQDDPTELWENLDAQFRAPFDAYLAYHSARKQPIDVQQYSAGLHLNGKSGKPHIHLNYCVGNLPANPLINFKYFYHRKWLPQTMPKDSYPDWTDEEYRKHLLNTYKSHFKWNNYSIRSKECGHLKGLLAYPFKECVDASNYYKATLTGILSPYTREELIAHGSGIYLASCDQHAKTEAKEEAKLEKWGQFCTHMDQLRNTPLGNEMRDLRGVALVALEHFRKQTERTSVNAVITMCKDYCFKRGIWTNQQILDKYQIV